MQHCMCSVKGVPREDEQLQAGWTSEGGLLKKPFPVCPGKSIGLLLFVS